jgi:hypothetical protein
MNSLRIASRAALRVRVPVAQVAARRGYAEAASDKVGTGSRNFSGIGGDVLTGPNSSSSA